LSKTLPKVQIIIGSTRAGRFSEKPARYISDELAKRGDVEVELIDLRDWPLPFYDEPISPIRIQGNYGNELAKKWAKKVAEADAFIMVTPEYNHGYPAVLKNAIDWLFSEWNNKPIGFVSYGNLGGARVIEQLRTVSIELQMFPIRSSVNIPGDIYMAASKEETPVNPELFSSLRTGMRGDRLAGFFDELVGLTETLKAGMEAKG
jgi:NAD(P)H-dependent FMN reductase